jgi:cell surface protein SprA
VNFAADPAANFGGIMRSLNSTNFEQGNVDYIQFWVMDPYIGKGNYSKQFRETIFQGEISEDVLKDGRKQYENGLGDQILVNPRPIWGDVPVTIFNLCLIPMQIIDQTKM